MKTYTIQADTTNGVYLVTSFDHHATILDQDSFDWYLSTLKDDEVIGSTVDQEFFDKINKEFGIRG